MSNVRDTGHILAARGPVVKHVDAATLRIVVAAVLAAAANAVIVAKHLPKRWTHLVTALARLSLDIACSLSLRPSANQTRFALV
jgi:hypothetical protein